VFINLLQFCLLLHEPIADYWNMPYPFRKADTTSRGYYS